jgi:DNA polymerase-3 subunit delta'
VKAEAEREEGDRLFGTPHPRERSKLIGHEQAQAEVLAAWNAGRLPHAFLIGGPEGVGKATLAYRIARFVLSNPKPDVKSLQIPPDHAVSRQVAVLSHPDLLVLRRIAIEEGRKLPSEIAVDEVRKTLKFFGSTAAYGGYRVCIVDSLDELNKQGANSLLKILEEPPRRAIFLLISHAPGRLLATVRSRCQKLQLRPLSIEQVSRAVTGIADEIEPFPRRKIKKAAEASGGSVRKALSLILDEGLEVRELTEQLLARLPQTDGEGMQKLGDSLRTDTGFFTFAETIEDWLAAAATKTADSPIRLARFAETWENVHRAAIETDAYGLDRKPLVFQVFFMLAEATQHA